MQPLIALLIIGLLKQDIGSNASIVKFPIVFYSCSSNIDVHPADRPIFMLDAINRFNALQNIFNGIIHRVLSGFDGKPLMPHILKGDHFLTDLLLAQFFPSDMFVTMVIRAVCTAVHTIIG